jgi:arylsulfatase A-like enzyme
VLLASFLLAAVALGAWLFLRPAPPAVVLVVLDTVRADHLSACGYARPTSPVLAGLVTEGASLHCRAYAPGGWTLPSHASFFTGQEPIDHGAHAITSGIEDYSGLGSRSRPLPPGVPTLATAMAERGFQPLALSASPVVSETMGLMQGFELHRVAPRWGAWYGDALVPELEGLLEERDPGRPMFLFVNIADAHQPWGRVPEGVDWVQPRRRLQWNKTAPEGDWQRFVEGRMPAEEAAELRAHAVDSYDWATFEADRVLGLVLESLEAGGHCAAGCRVIVTSDHGEMLGEGGLLDHGHSLLEANVRVPLLVWDSRPGVALPLFEEAAVAALEVYDLVLNGARGHRRAVSMSWPHARRCRHVDGHGFCSTEAGLWEGEERLLWRDGETSRGVVVGSEVEPVEAPFADHPQAATLEALADRVHRDTRDDHRVDQDVTDLLRSLGYLD